MYPFLMKLLLNGVVAISLLIGFTEASFAQAVLASIVLTVISYFLGDRLILEWTNNTVAIFADAVMAFAYFWIVAYYMNWTLSTGELITLVAGIAITEIIVHRIMANVDRGERAA